jgi:hypothetical protein
MLPCTADLVGFLDSVQLLNFWFVVKAPPGLMQVVGFVFGRFCLLGRRVFHGQLSVHRNGAQAPKRKGPVDIRSVA